MAIRATCLALVVLSTPAVGQDLHDTTPNSWAGWYAGATLGLGAGQGTVDSFGVIEHADLSGGLGTGHFGYNHAVGGLILGVEGDFSFGDVRHVKTDAFGTSIQRVGANATLRARAGMGIDRLMPYLTAGVAVGTGAFDLLGLGLYTSATHVGWTAGGGVEFALTDRLSTRVEYLHTDLGTVTYSPDWALPFDTTFRFGTFRSGFSVRF